MRWPWRRAKPVAPANPASNTPAPNSLAFDALIDIDPAAWPAGVTRDAAVQAASQAVARLAGAGWISIEVHRQPGQVSAQVFPAGTSVEPTFEPWPSLRMSVETAVRRALETMPRAAAPSDGRALSDWGAPADMGRLGLAEPLSVPLVPPSRPGFGEAISPAQLDALAQLAALASPAPRRAAATPAEPSSSDLLTRLLGFVLPGDSRPVAAAATARFGSVAAVLAAPEAELRQVAGLGTHSIAAIKLVHAAAIRLAQSRLTQQPVLDDWDRLAAYLSAALARERIEQFRILFLDTRGMLRADEIQASGTVNHTPVYPREVVRRALALQAASLVLVHNHPSGDPAPSREDIEMTRLIRTAARVMSLEVRDHIIVGNGRWLSFKQAGLLD